MGKIIVGKPVEFESRTVKYLDSNALVAIKNWVNKKIDEAKHGEYIPTVEHKCHNCGATLELQENDHIFKCHYCGTAYAVGTSMINDEG